MPQGQGYIINPRLVELPDGSLRVVREGETAEGILAAAQAGTLEPPPRPSSLLQGPPDVPTGSPELPGQDATPEEFARMLARVGGQGMSLLGGMAPGGLPIRLALTMLGGGLEGLGQEDGDLDDVMNFAGREGALEAGMSALGSAARLTTPLAMRLGGLRGEGADRASGAFLRQLDRTPRSRRPIAPGHPERAAERIGDAGRRLQAAQEAAPERIALQDIRGATSDLQERAGRGLSDPEQLRQSFARREADFIGLPTPDTTTTTRGAGFTGAPQTVTIPGTPARGQFKERGRDYLTTREAGELTSTLGKEADPVFSAIERREVIPPDARERAQLAKALRDRIRSLMPEHLNPIYSELSDLNIIRDAINEMGGVRARPFGSAMGGAVRAGLGSGLAGSTAALTGVNPLIPGAVGGLTALSLGAPGGLASTGNFASRWADPLKHSIRAGLFGEQVGDELGIIGGEDETEEEEVYVPPSLRPRLRTVR